MFTNSHSSIQLEIILQGSEKNPQHARCMTMAFVNVFCACSLWLTHAHAHALTHSHPHAHSFIFVFWRSLVPVWAYFSCSTSLLCCWRWAGQTWTTIPSLDWVPPHSGSVELARVTVAVTSFETQSQHGNICRLLFRIHVHIHVHIHMYTSHM